MRFGNLLNVMLHHGASAENFDVDGHTPTIRRRSCAGRHMSRGAGLVFRFRQAKAPSRNIHFFNGSVDRR